MKKSGFLSPDEVSGLEAQQAKVRVEYTLTPFKTVVQAQIYLNTIQDRLLELTSVPVEVEVANLKKTIGEFTSLSFFGLINLAFKRLFN